jgi:hypothetical protein
MHEKKYRRAGQHGLYRHTGASVIAAHPDRFETLALAPTEV